MTKLQNRQLSMYLAVLRFCREHPTLVALNPAFQRTFRELEQKTQSLQSAVRGQLQGGGESAGKSSVRSGLADTAAVVSGLVSGWAHEHGDAEMVARNSWNASDLERLPENKLPEVAALVLADAQAAEQAGADIGLSRELLTQLEAGIGLFREAKDKPRRSRNSRSTQTKKIAGLVTQVSEHLRKRMDKYALSYRVTHPDFYTEYKEARKLVDPATRAENEPQG